jgi:hypothetical protein
MEIISSSMKRTSKSLSEILLGPVALMAGVVLLPYIRGK